MNEVLEFVKINLEILIKENNAIITEDPLPIVKAEKTQMFELLQYLITNFIKCRSLKSPHISARKDGSNFLFSMKNNGIGIKLEYRVKSSKYFSS